MQIKLDSDDIRPLVVEIVQQAIALLGPDGLNKIAWPEDEAAALVGMQPHQLRDRRLEGLVKAKKVGRSFYYTRDELLKLVAS